MLPWRSFARTLPLLFALACRAPAPDPPEYRRTPMPLPVEEAPAPPLPPLPQLPLPEGLIAYWIPFGAEGDFDSPRALEVSPEGDFWLYGDSFLGSDPPPYADSPGVVGVRAHFGFGKPEGPALPEGIPTYYRSTRDAKTRVIAGVAGEALHLSGLTLSGAGNFPFVARYTLSGERLWAVAGHNLFGGFVEIVEVAIDPAGDVLVAGNFTRALGWGEELWRGEEQDGFIIKLAGKDGRLLWLARLGGAGGDRLQSLEVDKEGKIYALLALGAGTGKFPGGEVVKLGSDGSVLWRAQSQGERYNYGYYSALAPDGGLVVFGALEGEGRFGAHTVRAQGSHSFLARYSATGEVLWAKAIPLGAFLEVTPDGLIWLFMGGGGVVALEGREVEGRSGDILVARFTMDGALRDLFRVNAAARLASLEPGAFYLGQSAHNAQGTILLAGAYNEVQDGVSVRDIVVLAISNEAQAKFMGEYDWKRDAAPEEAEPSWLKEAAGAHRCPEGSTLEVEPGERYIELNCRDSFGTVAGLHTKRYLNGKKRLELDLTPPAPNMGWARTGPVRSWYADGTPLMRGESENGYKEGVWRAFYPNGQKARETHYQGGALIKETQWSPRGEELGRLTFAEGKAQVEAGDPVPVPYSSAYKEDAGW